MLMIFDWDGTLADSRAHIVAALQQTIFDMRLPNRSDQQCASIIGLGLKESAKTLFPDLDDGDAEQFRRSYSAHFLALGQEAFPLTLFDEVWETLEVLKARGHNLAVATGKSRAGLNRVLSVLGMQHLFDASRTADETASKPSPLMLRELLEETGEHVENAVMIGDTTYDLEMASRIDMPRIGVSYGVHGVQQLNRYQPLMVLDSIEKLLDWSPVS